MSILKIRTLARDHRSQDQIRLLLPDTPPASTSSLPAEFAFAKRPASRRLMSPVLFANARRSGIDRNLQDSIMSRNPGFFPAFFRGFPRLSGSHLGKFRG